MTIMYTDGTRQWYDDGDCQGRMGLMPEQMKALDAKVQEALSDAEQIPVLKVELRALLAMVGYGQTDNAALRQALYRIQEGAASNAGRCLDCATIEQMAAQALAAPDLLADARAEHEVAVRLLRAIRASERLLDCDLTPADDPTLYADADVALGLGAVLWEKGVSDATA